MFVFNSKTIVNKKFKLQDLFKQIHASKDIKQDTLNIESIVLKNVLSPKTLSCEEIKEIKEIYVFEIILKDKRIPEKFISELDKNIKLQTLFIFINEDYEYGYTTFKHSGKNKYFQTNWLKKCDEEIPLSLNIPNIYKYILNKFLKYNSFECETVDEFLKRYNQLIKLDYQIEKTNSAIAYESQSKKKFEYNSRLKEYRAEREELLKEK